tara:strand:+ start:186 stop:395 length:210 start_codon:yes stop_codon:yes gene_type:complete
MPKIKIDDVEYNTEDLSDNGILQLQSLQFAENQLVKVKNEIFAYQTARQAYLLELKLEIENNLIKPIET